MNLLPNEYTFLFNTISDAEEVLDKLRTELMNAQRHAEELFLEQIEEADDGASPLPEKSS